MIPPAAIALVLLGLRPYGLDRETPAERADRMAVIADGISAAVELAVDEGRWKRSEAPRLAALLVAVGFDESGFAKHVHEGKCRPWECDKGNARGPWQVHPTGAVPRDLWESIVGADEASTTAAATAAMLVLTDSAKECKALAPTLGRYMTGRCEATPAADARTRTYATVLRKIERARAAGE